MGTGSHRKAPPVYRIKNFRTTTIARPTIGAESYGGGLIDFDDVSAAVDGF